MRECIKCEQLKPNSLFCDMVNGKKGYECKECRAMYVAAYYLANKQRISDNSKMRRLHAKKFKT